MDHDGREYNGDYTEYDMDIQGEGESEKSASFDVGSNIKLPENGDSPSLNENMKFTPEEPMEEIQMPSPIPVIKGNKSTANQSMVLPCHVVDISREVPLVNPDTSQLGGSESSLKSKIGSPFSDNVGVEVQKNARKRRFSKIETLDETNSDKDIDTKTEKSEFTCKYGSKILVATDKAGNRIGKRGLLEHGANLLVPTGKNDEHKENDQQSVASSIGSLGLSKLKLGTKK